MNTLATHVLRWFIVLLFFGVTPGWSASIYLTGHDSDFHASLGENTAGARNINAIAINFIIDPLFNSFAEAGADKFLFVESKDTPPRGHTTGVDGIIASGFSSGTDFEHHDASTLDAELDLLGTKYSGIVVASDFGGILSQSELDILNDRSGDIVSFLNNNGGIYAMGEGNGGRRLTPLGGHFGFLPFVVTTTAFDQSETGVTLTPFGQSLGLVESDVNGNFSHNIFADDFGLNIVDMDQSGNILSLAGRGMIDPDVGVVPEYGATFSLLCLSLALICLTNPLVLRRSHGGHCLS